MVRWAITPSSRWLDDIQHVNGRYVSGNKRKVFEWMAQVVKVDMKGYCWVVTYTYIYTGSSSYCLCLWPISTFLFFTVAGPGGSMGHTPSLTCKKGDYRMRRLMSQPLSEVSGIRSCFIPCDYLLALLCWTISTQDHSHWVLQFYNLALRVLLLFRTFVTNSCLI